MVIPAFRDSAEAKRHITRLHVAFAHYEIRQQSQEGCASSVSLQQVYSLVARVLGYERWEDLFRALTCAPEARYVDLDGLSIRNAAAEALSRRFASLLGNINQADAIKAAIHFSGFGCSPAEYLRQICISKHILSTGMTASQFATVSWVDESFSRGVRHGMKDYDALDYLRRLVIAKYLGRPIPPRPLGLRITPDARIYERLLYRYLRIDG
ncbi:hypothetical protein [Pusillimonas sp.]|uniref:hypothetical protein n=1 Tax=Pusillimonas sp. TaxID=3040095 RepID=UPI0037C52586